MKVAVYLSMASGSYWGLWYKDYLKETTGENVPSKWYAADEPEDQYCPLL